MAQIDQQSKAKTIIEFFKDTNRPVTMAELKALTPADRQELANMVIQTQATDNR